MQGFISLNFRVNVGVYEIHWINSSGIKMSLESKAVKAVVFAQSSAVSPHECSTAQLTRTVPGEGDNPALTASAALRLFHVPLPKATQFVLNTLHFSQNHPVKENIDQFCAFLLRILCL